MISLIQAGFCNKVSKYLTFSQYFYILQLNMEYGGICDFMELSITNPFIKGSP